MDTKDTAGQHVIHTASGRTVRLPVAAAHFRSLMAYIDAAVMLSGCDNTLSHAEAWARAHGVIWGRLARSLRGLGAFCDCEIAMNIASSEIADVPLGDWEPAG